MTHATHINCPNCWATWAVTGIHNSKTTCYKCGHEFNPADQPHTSQWHKAASTGAARDFNFPPPELQRARQARKSMDEQMQTVICEALEDHEIAFVNLDEIAHRCEFRTMPNGQSVFCFDGQELIEFFPVEIKTEQKELSYFATYEQKYRKLY